MAVMRLSIGMIIIYNAHTIGTCLEYPERTKKPIKLVTPRKVKGHKFMGRLYLTDVNSKAPVAVGNQRKYFAASGCMVSRDSRPQSYS